jgi:hypothetical protein
LQESILPCMTFLRSHTQGTAATFFWAADVAISRPLTDVRNQRHGVSACRPMSSHREPFRCGAKKVDICVRQPGHRDPLREEDGPRDELGVPALPLPAGGGERSGRPLLAGRLSRQADQGDLHEDGPARCYVPESGPTSASTNIISEVERPAWSSASLSFGNRVGCLP